MSTHTDWIDQLSDYLDGELEPAAHDAVETHLASCADCTKVLNELRSVVNAAQSLPAREPSANLWEGISAGITRTPAQRIAIISRRRFSFTVSQLAAAAVLLIAVSGWIALRVLPAGNELADSRIETTDDAYDRLPVSDLAAARFDDPGYDAAVADLKATLEESRAALDPATVQVVEDDLLIIDQALDEARRALARDPANDYLTEHLVETKRRKLDLLRYAAVLSAGLD
jgi:anti-sigma factor RsiW